MRDLHSRMPFRRQIYSLMRLSTLPTQLINATFLRYLFFLQDLPLPLFKFLKLTLKEWQLGQINRRFSSLLSSELPFTWSISKATLPVTLCFVFHPQIEHFSQ